MSAKIVDRGRGPELEGTRVTVYRIMDFLRDGTTLECIAEELEVTEQQVKVAIEYIEAHRTEVESEYEQILRRVNQPNAPWVDAQCAKTPEELRQRILAHHSRKHSDAGRGRQ